MKNGFFATLQKVGQSLMIPVSVLPAAGLMVALGRIMQTDAQHPLLKLTGQVFFSGGLAIFEQLPVVFAVGVAIGFTGGAGIAGLAAVVGYFTMINVLKVVSEYRELALSINTGVFGGIIIGLLVAVLYQRYNKIRLPQVLGFFSGKRFVPIITAGSAILLGLVIGYVWPPIQSGINAFGISIMDSEIGPAFYAAGKRLLIPVGLHHVYYPPFLFQFGEYITASGQALYGESARYFGGDPSAGRFMASEFPLMLFGLPAAAFAMYLRAEKSKRKAVGGIMLTAALTSIITGITEPIEFAFIFVAPLLYVVHVGSAFMSGLMTNAFDIHLGYTFSASLIDYGLGFFNQKNSLLLFTVVGPITAAWYFSVFYFTIGFFDFKTPGREKSLDGGLENKPSITERSKEILAALGGKENIIELDACITRLRLTVKDGAQVDKLRLKELGAAGTLDAGKGNFQIIFGVESDHIKEDLKTLMSTARLIEAIDKNEATLRAVTSGRMLGISDVPDETFAEKILGDGYAIDPTEGKIQAPVDGTIMTVFRTNHAIGMQSTTGQEILIHVGVDTVKMDGRGFKTLVIAGQKVKAGDPLLEFDLELVRREAKSSITPVVITNLDQSGRLRALKTGNVLAGDNVMEIENPN